MKLEKRATYILELREESSNFLKLYVNFFINKFNMVR